MPYIPSLIPGSDLARFEKGNHGRAAGFGTRAAVIVVDMTKAFTDDRFPLANEATARGAIAAIARLLEASRAAGLPTFYTTGGAWRTPAEYGRWSDKVSGSGDGGSLASAEAHEIAPEIAPIPSEAIVVKAKPSAFFGTQLVGLLTMHQVDTVIVTGMTTSGCVRATVVDAFSYNYRVIVPIEGVADRGQVSHEISLFDMSMKYADVVPLDEVLGHLRALPQVERQAAQV